MQKGRAPESLGRSPSGALSALIAFYLMSPVGELEKSLRHLDKASLISGICKRPRGGHALCGTKKKKKKNRQTYPPPKSKKSKSRVEIKKLR